MKRMDLLKIGLGVGVLTTCGHTAPSTPEVKPTSAAAAGLKRCW